MGAPGTLGVLLCLLALLGPHPLGVTARAVPVPPTLTAPVTVPPTLPVTATAPKAVPESVPTTSPVPTVTVTVTEEEEEDDDDEEEEAEGRVMAALERLSRVLQGPPTHRRAPPGPETLLELIPELRDLLVPSLDPPGDQPPNPPPRGEA